MAASHDTAIHGHVTPGFESVREVFIENFSRRRELGAACCAYHHGENVVDLWGGVRNESCWRARSRCGRRARDRPITR